MKTATSADIGFCEAIRIAFSRLYECNRPLEAGSLFHSGAFRSLLANRHRVHQALAVSSILAAPETHSPNRR
jgi:hypothetical protein